MRLTSLALAAGLLVAGPAHAQITATASGNNPNFVTANPVNNGTYAKIAYYTDFTADAMRFNPSLFYATGSTMGFNAAPVGDTTRYAFAAPNPVTGGPGNTPTVFSTSGLDAFDTVSLLWGSIDGFNTISFLTGSTVVGKFDGSSFFNTPAENGLDTKYVTFKIDSSLVGKITGISFASNGANALEFDNFALGSAVPEPLTWALMILGLGMTGGTLRRWRMRRRVNFVIVRA
jgi:hypothetical protein